MCSSSYLSSHGRSVAHRAVCAVIGLRAALRSDLFIPTDRSVRQITAHRHADVRQRTVAAEERVCDSHGRSHQLQHVVLPTDAADGLIDAAVIAAAAVESAGKHEGLAWNALAWRLGVAVEDMPAELGAVMRLRRCAHSFAPMLPASHRLSLPSHLSTDSVR